MAIQHSCRTWYQYDTVNINSVPKAIDNCQNKYDFHSVIEYGLKLVMFDSKTTIHTHISPALSNKLLDKDSNGQPCQ